MKRSIRRPLAGLAAALAATLAMTMAPTPALGAPEALGAADVVGVPATVPLSSKQQIADWQKLQFGLFLHWGVYSSFAGSYNGKVQGIGYPEQIKAWMKIPDEDYLAEAAKMTADKWDPADVCQTAKDLGMKYVKITTKHHDGFAMWDTATTDYNVVKKTAFGKDPIAQLSQECGKRGIKLGMYFSIIDWTRQVPEPYGNRNPLDDSMMSLIKAQLTELLTNYGPVSELWFDMGGPTPEQSAQMAKWVHELQPATTVGSRVWNDKGDFEVGGDNSVATNLRTGPWESILSIFPECWGYCDTYKANRAESNIVPKSKSAISALSTVISGGGQFAYNIGPKGDGSFDPFDRAVLNNIGSWMNRHPKAITGARATWFDVPTWGRMTANGSDLFLILPNTQWKDQKTIEVPGLTNKVKSVTIDGTDTALAAERVGRDLRITLAGEAPDELMSVVKVSLDGEPRMVPKKAVAFTDGTATITGSDVIGRTSPKGYGFTDMDGYLVNEAPTPVAVKVQVAAEGVKADTQYRLYLGEKQVELSGAELLAGDLPRFVMAGDTVARVRVQYAKPGYYADALNLTKVSISAKAVTTGEALDQIEDAVARYVASGELAGPLAKQLTKDVAQAQKHAAQGRETPAIAALQRVIRDVEQPKKPDTLSREAAADLREQAAVLVELLSK